MMSSSRFHELLAKLDDIEQSISEANEGLHVKNEILAKLEDDIAKAQMSARQLIEERMRLLFRLKKGQTLY